jgi:hypothetical protein
MYNPMIVEDYNNVDEQIQKLEALRNIAYEKYKFYEDEYDAELEEGFEIHQDLIDKLNTANEDLKIATYNLHSLQRFCSINKIDLTKHWIRLGFTQKQVVDFWQQLHESLN